MRKLLTFLIALIVAASIAASSFAGWQSRDSNYNVSIVAGGGSSPTFTGQAAGTNTSCGFPTNCAVTLTATGGLLVVGISGPNETGVSASVSAVATSGACGSVSLTQAVSKSVANGENFIAIFYGTVSSGSCTITATSSSPGGFFQMGVAMGTLNNLTSTTPGSNCSNNYNNAGVNPFVCSSALTISSGGFAIGVFSSTNVSTTITPNTSSDASNTAGPSILIGNATTAGSFTPSFTDGNNFDNVSLAGAAWR